MEELYYSHPVQVRYWDAHFKHYMGGIAYHDFLILGRNGEIVAISTIVKAAKEEGKDEDYAIVELDWLNLNKAILGN